MKSASSTRKKRSSPSRSSPTPARRSPCPVACCLDIVGDRWTLLVIRDLFLGRTRFKDFESSPEGIPTNILAERLQRLQRHGLAEQFSIRESRHLAYRLTEKGRALLPVLLAMKKWGLKWEEGTVSAHRVARVIE